LDRGAPPETKNRTRPPVFSTILEKTSLEARARLALSPRGDGLMTDLEGPVSLAHPEGPEEDAPLEGRLGQDVVHDLGVDLVEEAGDADHDRRPDLEQVGGHRLDALRIGDRRPFVKERERRHALEDVRQREEGQDRVPVRELDDRVQGHGVGDEIRVAQHDALGDARRPRGVDDRGQVVGPDGQGRLFEEIGAGGGQGLATPHDLREAQDPFGRLLFDEDEVPDRGQFLADGLDLQPEEPVGADDDLGVRIVDDVLDLAGHEGGVDGDGDAARAQGREVRHRPLRPVLGEDGELVTRPEAEVPQAQGEVLDPLGESGCRQGREMALLLDHQQGVLGIGPDGVEKKLAQGLDHGKPPRWMCRCPL
jgi:hypothetical protein